MLRTLPPRTLPPRALLWVLLLADARMRARAVLLLLVLVLVLVVLLLLLLMLLLLLLAQWQGRQLLLPARSRLCLPQSWLRRTLRAWQRAMP
jgi:hypothetical protein